MGIFLEQILDRLTLPVSRMARTGEAMITGDPRIDTLIMAAVIVAIFCVLRDAIAQEIQGGSNEHDS